MLVLVAWIPVVSAAPEAAPASTGGMSGSAAQLLETAL